ncbi:MAG: SDR family NAD(P)-dependent oxidoreductase [Syntrophales bacterium]
MERIVIITGSTRGIGFATAAEFLTRGERVVLLCRHQRHVAEARAALSRAGREADLLGLVGDVRKPGDAVRIVAATLERFGRIDILVNNAGVAVYKPIEATTDAEWDRIIDTNLRGTFLLMRAVIPVMKQQETGIIINVSSGLGVEGMAGFSAYCASKFGVVGLTQAVADELTGTGIRVYAVLPGAVDTTLIAASGLAIDPADLLKPGYVARRIVAVAAGRKKSGTLIEVYS